MVYHGAHFDTCTKDIQRCPNGVAVSYEIQMLRGSVETQVTSLLKQDAKA